MKNKKVVALLLAAIMSLGCLAACGKESAQSSEVETQTQKESESVATESTEEVVELEEKTIQLWMFGPGKQKDSDKVWEAFNEKLQEYVPNTTVEITVMPQAEYTDNLARMLASGEKVDLAWVGYFTQLDQNIADGNLMPLDDLLAEYGQGIIDTLGEDVMNLNRKSDGHVYYTISWQGLVENKSGLWMPTELVELAGDGWVEDTQAAVNKWFNNEPNADNLNAVFDQLEKYLAACKEAGRLYSGIRPSNTVFAFYGIDVTRLVKNTAGVGVVRNSDGFDVIDGTQGEEMRIYTQRLSEFYEKGYIRSDIASVDHSTLNFVTNGEYNDNTVVMWTHNMLSEMAKDKIEKTAGVELTFIEREQNPTLGKGAATAMAVPYCADEPERAIMVLNALYTEPELYQLFVYGIEGEHYTTNPDGTVVSSGATSDSDYGLYNWTIGTCLNGLTTQSDTAGYYEDLKKAEESAIINPFMSFTFDTTNVSDIITVLTAIDSKYNGLVSQCMAGTEMEAALDEWIAERKAAGVDKLVEEYQKQLDEYIKANNITSW